MPFPSLNPYIAAAILSIAGGLFGAGSLVAALFVTVNQVSAGLMDSSIIWFVAWILSIVRLIKRPRLKQAILAQEQLRD